jgi:hypothetical protein
MEILKNFFLGIYREILDRQNSTLRRAYTRSPHTLTEGHAYCL